MLDGRNVRHSFYLDTIAQSDNDPSKAMSAIVSTYFRNVAKYDLDAVQFDGIGDNDSAVSMSDLIANTIVSAHKFAGKEITADSIDSAIIVTQKTLDSLDFDTDSATPEARGIVAEIVGLNIYSTINANAPFVGRISDLAKTSQVGKFKVYRVEGTASKDAGELKEGDSLLGANGGKKFVLSNRTEEQLFVAGTTDYTFNLKNLATDTDNFKMKRGLNSVTIGDVFVDDYEADSNARTSIRENYVTKADGTEVKVTVTFDYDGGTIKVVFENDIDADTPIFFEGVLDSKDIDKISGKIEVDQQNDNYVAIPVFVDVKGNTFDMRQSLGTSGVNITATGLQFALDKIRHEVVTAEFDKLRALAKPYGGVVDVKSATEDRLSDRYKVFTKTVANAMADILKESLTAGRGVVIGGSAVIDIVNGLGTSNDDVDRVKVQNGQNGLRKLDTLYGVDYYFDPTHDAQYPLDGANNDEHTVFVANIANETLKQPVIGGIGLPILPDKPIKEINGTDTVRLTGSVVIAPNKSARARKQVRKLKVIL
jgi:hypothetical protein